MHPIFNWGCVSNWTGIANLLPLYKSDDPFCFDNIITDQYLCYVFSQRFFNRLCITVYLTLKKTNGFRKSHPSQMALMTLMDKLIESLDKEST